MKPSIKIILPILVIGASLALYGGMVYFVDRSTIGAREEAQEIYQELRDEVAMIVAHSELRLTELVDNPAVMSGDPEKCGLPLAEMLNRHSEIHDVFLRIRPDGMLDCTPKGGSQGIDFSNRLYFKKAVEQKGFIIGEFLIGKVSKKPVLAVSMPILDANGNVAAVLAAGLKTDWLQEIIDRHKPSRSLVVEIQDSSGTLMSYFIRGQSQEPGKDMRAELIRLPLLPDRSDAQVVIYEQT